jgi:VCBS repeat-containing protein
MSLIVSIDAGRLWESDDNGSESYQKTAKFRTLNVRDLLLRAFADTGFLSERLGEYGLELDVSSDFSSIGLDIEGIDFPPGQSGFFDLNLSEYTPSWDIALSEESPIFSVTYKFKDPYNYGDSFNGDGFVSLTVDIALLFDRSGLNQDLSVFQFDPLFETPISVSSVNAVGILLAYGQQFQEARGRSQQPLLIAVEQEQANTLVVPFDSDIIKASFVVESGSLIADPESNKPPILTYSTSPRSLVEAGDDLNAISGVSTSTVVLNASDSDGNPLTYLTTGWAPVSDSGLFSKIGVYGTAFLNTATGVVTYTLDNSSEQTNSLQDGQTVSDSFSVALTDGVQTTALEDIVFNIIGSNDAPSLEPVVAGSYVDSPGNNTSFSPIIGKLTADDPEGQTLSFGITDGSVANGFATRTGIYGTLTLNTTTGEYVYTPNAALINTLTTNATDAFTFTVSDNATGFVTTDFKVNISGVLDTIPPSPPVLLAVAGDNQINTAEKSSGVSLSGTAEAGSLVTIAWGESTRTTTASSAGIWSLHYAAAQIPSAGEYTLTLTSEDTSGNKSLATERVVKVVADNLPPTGLVLNNAGIPKKSASELLNTPLGTLVATDPDGQDLRYDLAPATTFNDNSLVDINPSTGVITLRPSVDQDNFAAILASRTALRISVTATEIVEPEAEAQEALAVGGTFLIPIIANLNNSAPTVVTPNEPVSLASVNEGANPSTLSGNTVSSLFGARFLDQNLDGSSNGFAAVAVVNDPSLMSQGRWQYRSASGSLWQNLPLLSESDPFILLSGDRLRFVPGPGFVGSPGSLSVRLLDNSNTWKRGRLNQGEALAVGGFGSASSDLLSLTTTVLPTPKRPTELRLVDVVGVPSSSSGTPFATAVGTDLDSPNSLEYTLVYATGASGANVSADFALNSSTGQLSRVGTAALNESAISFRLAVSDGQTTPLERSFTLGVLNNTNLAPQINQQATLPQLSPVLEGASNPPGDTVGDLFASSFQDSSAGSQQVSNGTTFAGVAIIQNAAKPLQGAWQYRLTPDGSWLALPQVAETTPFLLAATAELRFLPRPGFSGSPGSLNVRLLDGSESFISGLRAGALSSGGSSSASASLLTLSTQVNPQPQAPNALFLASGALLPFDLTSSNTPIATTMLCLAWLVILYI